MNTLRACIVGCGSIFPMHAYALDMLPDAEIAAVCDIKEDRAEKWAAEFKTRAYVSLSDMLEKEKPDVLHICTPHYLHAPMAINALKSGIHVLTEKPMSISVRDATAMQVAAEQNGRTLGVIFQNHFNPGSVLIKSTLESGELGQVITAKCELTWNRGEAYYADDWHGQKAKEGGGVIINQAIHTLDLMRWFMDAEIDYVEANTANRFHPKNDVEDMAEGVIVYKNGVRTSFYTMNYYGSTEPIRIHICCEKGTAEMTGAKATICFRDGQVLSADNDMHQTLPNSHGKTCWGIGHYRQIQDFYDCLRTGEQPAVTGEYAIKTQQMVEAIYRAGETHTRVCL